MTSLKTLQKEIENYSGVRLQLKINDNRSTMLSVRWEPDCTKVSLHRIFLDAPRNVMESLACYIRKEHRIIAPNIKAFIEDNLKKMDYSHLIDKSKLYTQGNVYNLQHFYDEINQEYFGGELNLLITWFGKPKQSNRSRVTFGLYHDPIRLIKINRLLDSPLFPDYFVSYVIYHEMLHHVCPAYVDEKGLNRVHNKEFKELEVQHRHYDMAQKWIREHQTLLFQPS